MVEHVIRKVLDVDGGVKLNGIHKVEGYAGYLALLGQHESEIKVMTEILHAEENKVGL